MMHKVIAIGRLGRNPYTTTTKNGNTFTTFTVATDGPKGTTWFKVETWGKLAEVCAQYLSKGRLVYVEGTVGVEMWTDKEGKARADLVLNARTVKFLDGNGHKAEAAIEDASGNGDETAANESAPEPEPEPKPEPAKPAPAVAESVVSAAEQAPDDFYDFDDLPF